MTELEALDDDVLALLRDAQRVPELASDAKEAMFANVTARVTFVPQTVDPQRDSDRGGNDVTPSGGSPTTATPGGAAAGMTPAASGFALAGGKVAAVLIGTFAIGMVVGVTLDRQIGTSDFVPSPPSAIVGVTTSAPPSARPAVSAEASGVPVEVIPTASSRPLVSAYASVAPSPVVAPAPSARGLGAERALLDVARGALARGEANEALIATGRHVSEYPSGVLVEEREAIAIKALVALGRRDEARARAVEMERRFPNGLMLRAVKGAVEAP